MSLNFIKAWRNDKWYNKRVLIWHFTLVLIKINYGQIGDQTGLFYTTNPVFYTRQSVRWKPMFFRTELIFTRFVRRTGMLGNLWTHWATRAPSITLWMTVNILLLRWIELNSIFATGILGEINLIQWNLCKPNTYETV